MKTGYRRLDKMLGGGIKKGEVTIIAGRPGMYKKTFALNIASGLAKNFNKTMFFSTYLSEKLIKERINKICEDESADDGKLIKLKDLFVINDSSYLTPNYIEKQIDSLSSKSPNISTVIIDCFNDIVCDNWAEIQRNAFSSEKLNRSIVMNELRRIARDKNIAIILCANLDRELETRDDHKPNIEDLLRLIDKACFPDNILFMFRDYYNDSVEFDNEKVEVHVSLNRNCETGKINYRFIQPLFLMAEEKK